MADGCDDPQQIDELARLVERGVVVAAASRYMPRRPAGRRPVPQAPHVADGRAVALHWLARVGTRDATNSFKAYDRDFVREVGIESDAGFEIGIELVAKARRLRLPVAEIPTIWLDRTHGAVELQGLRSGCPATCAGTATPSARSSHARAARPRRKEHREQGPGHRLVRLHRRLRRRGAAGRGHEVVGIDNHSKYGPVAHVLRRRPRLPASSRATCRDVDLMTELLADCDHFIAGAAMIGGISYFHTYAYDLLATNERIIAASCDAAIAGAPRAAGCRRSPTCSSSMVFESTDRVAVVRGPGARDPAAAVVLRLPEAGRRVLRPGRLGPVPAAVHDRPAVQLRRHRRGPGPRRGRGAQRQREAGHEPRRARPRAEGRSRARTRCTSWATAPRSGTTPTAATWPAASSRRWSTPTPATTTSTSRPPSRPRCSSWPR